jgi:hypothetical protein
MWLVRSLPRGPDIVICAPRSRAGRASFSALATLALSLGLGLVASPDAAAQQVLPLRIDCGDLNGDPAPEAGWTLLGEGLPAPGVTLSPAPLDTVHVAGKAINGAILVPADVWAVDPDELGQRHRLTSLCWPPTRPQFRRLGSVLAEQRHRRGAKTASPHLAHAGARAARPAASRAATSRCYGLVRSGAGAQRQHRPLVLRFSSTAMAALTHLPGGFEVHRYEALPVVYHKQAARDRSSRSSRSSRPRGGLQRHTTRPEAAAAALTDSFQRGASRAAGWRLAVGSRDGRFHLLPAARADPSRRAPRTRGALAALNGRPQRLSRTSTRADTSGPWPVPPRAATAF